MVSVANGDKVPSIDSCDFDLQMADALKAYASNDTKKFLKIIGDIHCIRDQLFPVKGGVAIIKDDYFLNLNVDYNAIIYNVDANTKETWQGKPSRDIEVVMIDPFNKTISNNVTKNHHKNVLVLFCRERVYVLDYYARVFGYYTNHLRELIPEKWPDTD